jgi:HlyD family secretion protein
MGIIVNRAIPFILGILIGVGAIAAYFAVGVNDWFADTPEQRPTEDEYDSAPREVSALGRIQPASGVISVAGPPGDRILSISIKEGKKVEQGDPIVQLASSELTQLQLDVATARTEEAETRITAEEKVAQEGIDAARLQLTAIEDKKKDRVVLEKQVALAQKNLEQAETELESLVGLSDKLVSPTKKSRQRLLVEKADLQVEVAQAELAQFDRELETAEEAANSKLKAAIAAKEVVPAAVPKKSLEAAKNLASYQNDQAVIKAPIGGEILNVMAKAGQTIGPQPLLQMANLDAMEVIAEVYESDLKHIRINQRVEIASRAFKQPYTKKHIFGRVRKMGQVISTPAMQTLDPFAQADRRVGEVRIEITKKDNDAGAIQEAARLINLQVEVKFLLKGDKQDVEEPKQ